MDDELMRPKEHDDSIQIPITFDYKGGRSSNTRLKTIASFVIFLIMIVATVGIVVAPFSYPIVKLGLVAFVFYILLFIVRFVIFRESYYSRVYEGLINKDFKLDITSIWSIFEISDTYPYIVYFKNGQKGLFVRMEMGTITGKSETVMYDHYEAISDAYNIAHSLNMNIIHIDYMDNVGNDSRLLKMQHDLLKVKNPEMRDMLSDIYANLQDEMTRNYANFDVYLFLTKDKIDNFIYNVRMVANKMTEGNFITYKIMNHDDIANTAKAIFNLHEFSAIKANSYTLQDHEATGIIPIRLYHPNGMVEEINPTQAEKRERLANSSRRSKENRLARKELRRKERELRRKKRRGQKVDNFDDMELDLFGDGGQFTPPDMSVNLEKNNQQIMSPMQGVNLQKGMNPMQGMNNMQNLNNQQFMNPMQNMNRQQNFNNMQGMNQMQGMNNMQNINNQQFMNPMQNMNNR